MRCAVLGIPHLRKRETNWRGSGGEYGKMAGKSDLRGKSEETGFV